MFVVEEQEQQVFYLEPLAQLSQPISHHSTRVSQLCVVIGMGLGLSEVELGQLRAVGLLHDIGKTTLPLSVLNKPARLTKSEYEIVQCHTWMGANMLIAAGYDKIITQGVRNHHERLDGTGYPRGLKARELDLFSKIVAVADVYEAMTSDRPYRRPLPPAVALKELRRADKYDQDVTQALVTGLATPAWNMGVSGES